MLKLIAQPEPKKKVTEEFHGGCCFFDKPTGFKSLQSSCPKKQSDVWMPKSCKLQLGMPSAKEGSSVRKLFLTNHFNIVINAEVKSNISLTTKRLSMKITTENNSLKLGIT